MARLGALARHLCDSWRTVDLDHCWLCLGRGLTSAAFLKAPKTLIDLWFPGLGLNRTARHQDGRYGLQNDPDIIPECACLGIFYVHCHTFFIGCVRPSFDLPQPG